MQIQSQVDHIREHTAQLEQQMSECTTAHNELVDAHMDQAEEIQQLKLTEFEDRSRRNNFKFRGIPELVLNNDLILYIQYIFLKLFKGQNP